MQINDSATKNAILSALSSAMGAGGSITLRDAGAITLARVLGVVFAAPSACAMTSTATSDSDADNSGTKDTALFKTSGGTTIFTMISAEITVTGPIVQHGTMSLTSGSVSV